MASIFTARWRLGMLAALVLLAAALPAAADAGGGGHGCAQPLTSGAGVEVTIDQICFDPTVVHVAAGDTVTWTNEDAVQHTVTGAQAGWQTGKETLGSGASFSHTFDEAGVYPYYCAFHVGQMGAVVVGDGGGEDVSAMNVAATSSGGGGPGAGAIVGMLAVGGAVAMVGGVAYRARRG